MSHRLVNEINPKDRGPSDFTWSGIYGLIDPVSKRVRYVGHSADIEGRYYGHIHSTHRSGTGSRVDWIRSLREAGQKPLCAVIETATHTRYRKLINERLESVISELQAVGEADLNQTAMEVA